MTDTPRGPLCTSRLGPDFIDAGTSALTQSPSPGPQGMVCLSNRDVPYPRETANFAAWLIRQGYIQRLTLMLPPTWTAMSESALTSYLTTRYSEQDLEQTFLMRYDERLAIKAQFRSMNIIAALLIGLIWARNNVKDGDWGTALAKIGVSGGAAIALNQVLFARDASAAEIMAQKAGNFGKWFQGAARSNRYVNVFVELNMISTVAKLGLSGGGEYPSIPWDIIIDIDIDDPATWRQPPPTLLALGFNVWYRQKDTNIYFGYVEGSLTKTILENTFLSKDAW